MKKLLSLLLACALLCGCGQTSTPADVTTTTPDNVSEESDNRFENYDFSSYAEEIKYNENPDISSKAMPIGYQSASWIEPVGTQGIIGKDSGKTPYGLVVVKILSNDKTVSVSPTGDTELDNKLNDKYGTDAFTSEKIKIATAEVLSSICGEHNVGDVIDISQYAAQYGVNLVAGKEYLIATSSLYVRETQYYQPIRGIHSIFEIKDDFTVYSESPLTVCSRYDGLSLADTAHDLKIAFEELTK